MRILSFMALMAAMTCSAYAAPVATPRPLDLNALCTPPRPLEVLDKPTPKYPKDALTTWSEGYALFMANVGADGKVQNLETLDYVGPSAFRDAAAKAARQWRYKPLVVDGSAVPVYGQTISLMFVLTPEESETTHPAFVQRYKDAREKIGQGKFDEAAALLNEARQKQQLNHYEQALSAYVLALIAQQKGDWRAALSHVRHATLQQGGVLDDDTAPAALRMRVSLEAQDGALIDALCTFEVLKTRVKPIPDDDAAAVLAAKLTTAMSAPAPLAVEGAVFADRSSSLKPAWRHRMLRRQFYFEQAAAGAKNFRLVCTRTVLEEAVNTEMVWEVPANAGLCTLFVFGDPGATVKLVEEW